MREASELLNGSCRLHVCPFLVSWLVCQLASFTLACKGHFILCTRIRRSFKRSGAAWPFGIQRRSAWFLFVFVAICIFNTRSINLSKSFAGSVGVLPITKRIEKISKATSVVSFLRWGWKFLKKLWCCVGGGSKVIWLYQLSWKCKLATFALTKGSRSKRQLFNSLRWPIYIFNLVDITKFLRWCLEQGFVRFFTDASWTVSISSMCFFPSKHPDFAVNNICVKRCVRVTVPDSEEEEGSAFETTVNVIRPKRFGVVM